MTLITSYKEELSRNRRFKIVSYTIGSVSYVERRRLDGELWFFKCYYKEKSILGLSPAISNNYFRLMCEVTGIDV